jgi:hypothetical protein
VDFSSGAYHFLIEIFSGLFLSLLRNKGHEKSGVPVLPMPEARNAACVVQYIFQSVLLYRVVLSAETDKRIID